MRYVCSGDVMISSVHGLLQQQGGPTNVQLNSIDMR